MKMFAPQTMSAASATIIMHAREYRKCLETGKITNLELWRVTRAPNTARGVTEFVINLLHLNLMIGMVVILSEHQLRVQSLWLRHSQQVQDVVGDLALSVHPEGQAAHLRHAVPVPMLPQVLGDLLQASYPEIHHILPRNLLPPPEHLLVQLRRSNHDSLLMCLS